MAKSFMLSRNVNVDYGNDFVQQKPKYKLVILILYLITLLYSGHAFYTFFSETKYLVVISFFICIPAIFQLVFSKHKLNDGLIVYFLMIAMLVFTALSSNFEGIVSYALLGCLLTTAFGISVMYSFNKFVDLFLKSMVVIALLGIIGHILEANTDIIDLFPDFTNSNGIKYKSIFFHSNIPVASDRNCGMFWEPGLFATFLLYAIVFELIFKNKKASILRLLLFTIAIITTTSSAGYAILLLCCLLFLSVQLHRHKSRVSKIFLLICIGLVLLFIISLNFIIRNSSLSTNEHLRKLLIENLLDSSRVKAITHNLNIFAEYPLFGAGLQRALDASKHVSDTSTSTYMLSVFGILGGLYTFWWLIGVLKIRGMSFTTKLILLVILLCIVNKEPHMFNLFSWILLFYLIQGKPSNEMEIKKLWENR